MRYLGIDYGTKKLGIATSDERGELAFPREVLVNNAVLLEKVMEIIKEVEAEEVIIGESKNFKGKDNPVMKYAEKFAESLKSEGVKVSFEPEFMTSEQARKWQGNNDKIDASAAAIILQSFLDRKNNRSIKE